MSDKQHRREQIAELGAIYKDTLDRGHGVITRFEQGNRAAEKILAAGYVKPRIINSREELDGLPEESVVIDYEGDVSQKRGGLWCGYETAPLNSTRLARIAGPFTVLYEPEPTS